MTSRKAINKSKKHFAEKQLARDMANKLSGHECHIYDAAPMWLRHYKCTQCGQWWTCKNWTWYKRTIRKKWRP